VLFATNAVAMSDSEKQRYLDFVKENLDNYDDTSYITLGMAPDGCWAVGYHNNLSGANRSAIKKCKKHCDASSCEVVDRKGRSDFIKAKGMPFPVGFGQTSGSSSSSSSSQVCKDSSDSVADSSGSDGVWCATRYQAKYRRRSDCVTQQGRICPSQNDATKEHLRLKNESTSSSSSSSSSSDVAYCLSKKYRRFVYINMSGGCSGSGRNISLEEYDLYNGCLINLGLTPKAASLSKKENSDLNECLIDVGSSYAETSSNTSGGSDR
jgi:hypothetical protein